MRYSEAILRLEQDPTLEFKLFEGGKTWTLKTEDNAYFDLECDSEYYTGRALEFSGNLLINDDRWELVRPSVSWQEAIQEFAKGKKLNIKFHNQEWTLGELVQLPEYLDIAIKKGEWYVED